MYSVPCDNNYILLILLPIPMIFTFCVSLTKTLFGPSPANKYMLNVKNKNNKKSCGTCSKLTIKMPERGYRRHSDVFIANSVHIQSSIAEFKQVNVCYLNI